MQQMVIKFILMNLPSFVLGVLASIFASVIYEALRAHRVRRDFRALDGYWLEVVPASPDRSYSIGRFHYDRSAKAYTFDGTNFQNTGEVFCTWESIQVHCDRKARKIYYIFRASVKDALHAENSGFGVVNLTDDKEGLPLPESGYYRETKEDAKPYSHSMIRLEKVCSDLQLVRASNETVEAFHSRLVQKFHQKRVGPLKRKSK
jgi:hypothetical protein